MRKRGGKGEGRGGGMVMFKEDGRKWNWRKGKKRKRWKEGKGE